MNTNTTGLALLLPAALNPAVAAAIGIGLVGFGIYRLLGYDDEDRESEALLEPSQTIASTVEDLVPDGSHSVRTLCSEQSPQDDTQNADLDEQDVDVADLKQAMIREAMSELGKRSAAARARKKAEDSVNKTV